MQIHKLRTIMTGISIAKVCQFVSCHHIYTAKIRSEKKYSNNRAVRSSSSIDVATLLYIGLFVAISDSFNISRSNSVEQDGFISS